MYRQLIDKYGIHGAMIIVGGILLNICVGASLFRQPKCFRRQTAVRLLTNNDTKERNPKLGIRKKLIEMFNAYRSLMNNPTFLIYCTAISFAFASNVLMFIILPPHMLHEHFTKQDVIIVLIVVGGVELIARFVAGKILDLGYFTVQTLFVVNMFVGGICSIIFPFFRHMGINIAYSVIFAVFPGVIQIATPMLIVSILGFKALSTAYPLSHMIINFVMLIVSPLLGKFLLLEVNLLLKFYKRKCTK
jgi:predicted MFS family arabinose efflux permease